MALDAPQLFTAEYGTVDAVDVAATVDGDHGAIFLVNRLPDRALETEIRLPGLAGLLGVEHLAVADARDKRG